jgi:hypothetical protein
MQLHLIRKYGKPGKSSCNCKTQKEIVGIRIDMAAKRRKNHKNQISGLVISMGYKTEFREF